MWVGREGYRSPLQESVESLRASRYGADVEWSLGRRREMHNATRGERRTPVGSPMFPSGAFIRNEREEVLGGNLVLKASYRDNVKP